MSADSPFAFAADYIGIAPHGMATTHLDALCHIFYEGKIYNGYSKDEVRTDGAQKNSIMAGAEGIVSRGVLLDIPAVRDTDFLERGASASPSRDLEAAEARQGVRVESGDILLVYTGRDPAEGVAGADGAVRRAGRGGCGLPPLASRARRGRERLRRRDGRAPERHRRTGRCRSTASRSRTWACT